MQSDRVMTARGACYAALWSAAGIATAMFTLGVVKWVSSRLATPPSQAGKA